jgi:hypothetical protein
VLWLRENCWKSIKDLSKAIVKNNLVHLLQRKERSRNVYAVSTVLTLLHGDNIQAFLIANLRDEYIDRNQQDLETLTWQTSNFNASDGKDKIFALPGLTNPPSPLLPDCALSIYQIYTSATILILRQNGDLRNFHWFRIDCSKEHPGPKLSTWVYDFRLVDNAETFAISTFPQNLYSAARLEDLSIGATWEEMCTAQVLILKGISVSEIKELGTAAHIRRAFMTARELRSPSSVLGKWKLVAGLADGEYNVDNLRQEIIWRTVLVDKETIDFGNDPMVAPFRRLNSASSFKTPGNEKEEAELIKILDIETGP